MFDAEQWTALEQVSKPCLRIWKRLCCRLANAGGDDVLKLVLLLLHHRVKAFLHLHRRQLFELLPQ